MNNETIDSNNSKKSNNTIKYIIFSIIFFGLGLSLGVFCTNRILSSKHEEITNTSEESGPLDITENEDYQAIINKLLNIMNKDVIFYNSQGLSLANMGNDTKLKLSYSYIINNNLVSTEAVDAISWTATVCNYDFLTEYAQNADGTTYNTGKCNIERINFDLIKNTYNDLFNDDNIDLSQEFFVSNDKKCIVENESFICGKVQNVSGITGSLDGKFSIEKVTIDEDGTIKIYEKGYLIDTRSNIINPNDRYDNYYLHSSDSTAYYYELRSADNLTFVHTFKLNKKNNYYYVDTILDK